MKTEDREYADYLRGKFLPGRTRYLETFIYPRYLRELPAAAEVWDLGFGNGEFLSFCRRKSIPARGLDSNPHFVESARNRGLRADSDDITRLTTIPDGGLNAAISDNVLEHLDAEALRAFFSTLKSKLSDRGLLLAIVPGEKGFTRDPTHKTFIDEAVMERMTKQSGLVVERCFRWPFGARAVSRIFYLNMTAFVIRTRV